MAKLSVLVPVYNRELYISQAIDSILNQNFADFELIVLNDGSTDGTEKIIKSYNDPRIRYYYQNNSGEYPTTNRLFGLVGCEYVTWVHSDDTLPQGSLKARVEALDGNPAVDLVHGDIIKVDSAGEQTAFLPATDDDAAAVLRHYCLPERERTRQQYFVHHLTFMFRWQLIDQAGPFDETLPFGGDLDWTMRMLNVAKIKRVPTVLYNYRRHGGTVSNEALGKGIPIADVTRSIQMRYCGLAVDTNTNEKAETDYV